MTDATKVRMYGTIDEPALTLSGVLPEGVPVHRQTLKEARNHYLSCINIRYLISHYEIMLV